MSILKLVLTEALESLFRRSPTEKFQKPIAETRKIDEGGNPVSRPEPLRTSQSGIKAVILNWKSGENDPFSVVSDTIRQHFHACGKNVEVIELSEGDWAA